MATTALTAINDVLSRIRDPLALICSSVTPPTTADGQAFVLKILGMAQSLIGRGENLFNTSESVTQTVGTGAIIPLPADVLKVLAVDRVKIGLPNTSVEGPVDWKVFPRHTRTWWNGSAVASTDATAATQWSTWSTDILLMVPALSSGSINYSFTYNPIFALFSTINDLFTIPDDGVTDVVRLTELVCLIKTRQLTNFAEKLKVLSTSMKGYHVTEKSTDRDSGL